MADFGKVLLGLGLLLVLIGGVLVLAARYRTAAGSTAWRHHIPGEECLGFTSRWDPRS